MKISIITKTFRLHDNPFLDSDIYIIYIKNSEYGIHQKIFLDNILTLHISDLKSLKITPILLSSLDQISNFINNTENNSTNNEIKIFVDNINPIIKYPFEVQYIPTWCLIDWTDKVDMIKKWFLPEALKNHKEFKNYVHANKRPLHIQKIKETKKNIKIKSNYIIQTHNTPIFLPEEKLDKFIIKKLKKTIFIKKTSWYKPHTSPTTSILFDEKIPDNTKTSKLSPFIALGVISPLLVYNFYTGETRMGSGRDQLLFREMFHACAHMKEFWRNDFGQPYKWKQKNKLWNQFINGTTKFDDLNFAMNQLKKEGWIHHLARHLVADYLTRGKLNIHWKFGMDWFKKQLIDHDPAVNRANWMWLSGTAFSSKQRSSIYHYNYNDYLTRLDKKLIK